MNVALKYAVFARIQDKIHTLYVYMYLYISSNIEVLISGFLYPPLIIETIYIYETLNSLTT